MHIGTYMITKYLKSNVNTKEKKIFFRFNLPILCVYR